MKDGSMTILQRLSKSIRGQDWIAVLIEFVVVVVGIFAGLQANEWAQERSDRKHERAGLERLFLEANGSYLMLDQSVQRTRYLNSMRREAVRFADSDLPVPQDELPLKIGINTIAIFPAVIPIAVAYDELRSSGQLQLIQSDPLREQLAEFHANLAFHNQQLATFREGADRFSEVYQRHVIWDYNPDATTSDILLSTYDWESLRWAAAKSTGCRGKSRSASQ